jgi:transposase
MAYAKSIQREAVRALHNGATPTEVAHRFKVSLGTVRNWVAKGNGHTNGTTTNGSSPSGETIEALRTELIRTKVALADLILGQRKA